MILRSSGSCYQTLLPTEQGPFLPMALQHQLSSVGGILALSHIHALACVHGPPVDFRHCCLSHYCHVMTQGPYAEPQLVGVLLHVLVEAAKRQRLKRLSAIRWSLM